MSQRVLPIIASCVVLLASSVNMRAQNSATTPASPAPQKKVWTNDEISAEDPRPGISTVGKEADNAPGHGVTQRTVSARGRNAKWYQDQIAVLQTKIPALDSEIAELQAAIDGKTTGDGKKSARPYGVRMGEWSKELAELQKRREAILSQISALRDQARHNGVAANAIP